MIARDLLKTLSFAVFFLAAPLFAQQVRLTLDMDKPGHAVSPTLYGLMIEEINHSIDGGLYAELVQNRAFHADWSGTPPGIFCVRVPRRPPPY